MAPSFKVILAVVWVFPCIDTSDFGSMRRSSFCVFHGKVFKDRTQFYYPPNTCKLYRCRGGQVRFSFTGCRYEGRCFALGFVRETENGYYGCLLDDSSKPIFVEDGRTGSSPSPNSHMMAPSAIPRDLASASVLNHVRG
ncbi:hypothetical protein PoB_002445000 [Plakobranchus ocellatus]|uniref:Secreted protein n=1 Tax=Plakobranchus ocellatus TaxID=259542 RepID=A0AAV3ZTI9_9GAST|nr:hypothetical protein PoB_002445000 [Plakobranchus ocellatus]